MTAQPPLTRADAVVVGAGPGGSTAAAHLAMAGREVVLLEKDTFPREKVCGDGLTPRVVRELSLLGLTEEAAGLPRGWAVQRGLRIHGGRTALELPWPQLKDWPAYGMTCTRLLFDQTLARHAVRCGAELWEGVEVTAPVRQDGDDRVAGVRWRDAEGHTGEVRAPVVLAADGASSRMGLAVGVRRRRDRPLAVAARTYYESPASSDPWISSFLDLRDGEDLLPGYGWVFPLDDGTINVGLGILDTSPSFGRVNYRDLLQRWAGGIATDWGTGPEARRGAVRSGPLPMAFNRTPLHRHGVVLIGDAAGMINPFNGEGISYAMESARLAAEVCDRALTVRRTAVLDAYDRELRRRWGGYYTLGRTFARLIGHPEIMRICTTYGLPRPRLMGLAFRLMAHLSDRRPSDAQDLIINTLTRLAPAA